MTSARFLGVVAIIALIFALSNWEKWLPSQTGPGVKPATPSVAVTVQPTTVTDDITSAVALLNQVRATKKESPLALDGALSKTAFNFGKDLLTLPKLTKKDSAGHDAWDRVAADGYKAVRVGEVIASGYATFADAFADIKTSPSDIAILTDGNYSSVGIGKVNIGTDGKKFLFVLIVAKPKS
jgi:uncharacterized protein YkwD